MDEVNELMDKNSGGNAAAVHVWLQKAPKCGQKYPGGARPKEGDRVEVFKQFVLDAYEYGKFRADAPYQPGSSSGMESSNITPVTSKPSSPVKKSTVAPPAANLLDDSSFADFQSAQQPAVTSSKASSSFDPFGSQSDPFQKSNFDPFAAPQQSAPQPQHISAKKPSAPVSAPAPQVSLMDFNDPVPSKPAASTSSFAADFADFAFSSAPVPPAQSYPQPVQQQQQNNQTSVPLTIQPPAAPPAFDPFGGPDLLTPVGSNHSNSYGNSPVKAYPAANNASAPVNPFRPGQSPAPASPYGNPPGNPNNNNILNLFSGMTFDANSNPGSMKAGVGSNAYNNNRPPAMMNSASAISQIDVFANPAPMNPGYASGYNSYSNSANNSGRWNGGPASAPPNPFINRIPVNGSNGLSTGNNSNPNTNSFDFLQDTMKKHLNDPYSQNRR